MRILMELKKIKFRKLKGNKWEKMKNVGGNCYQISRKIMINLRETKLINIDTHTHARAHAHAQTRTRTRTYWVEMPGGIHIRKV